MATGFRIPFKQDGRTGGVSVDDGDDYIRGLLLAALNDCESANPFQDLGIGNHIFKLDESAFRTVAKEKVRNVFEQFKADKLADLAAGGIEFLDQEVEGEVLLSIKYIDLETEEVNELEVTYLVG